ncbi:MAG TPA: ATP-binding protein [Acidimicrobiales bacterium]|nr:ATP-binding protein [Acidimicrobiales bacterium]
MSSTSQKSTGSVTRPLDAETADWALGALTTLVPIAVFAADPDGRCWYVNQRLIDAFGLEHYSAEDATFRLDLPDGVLPTEGTAHLEVVVAGAEEGGDRTRLDARVMPLVGRDGRVTAYVGVVVDSTGSQGSALVLRTSERLVDALIDRSPEVVTILDEDGTWRYSNAAAWRLLGYQADFEPVPDGIIGLVHPDDAAEALQLLDRLRSGEVRTVGPVDVRVRAADGGWRYLENYVENLLDDPVIHGFLLLSRDVSERRQARLELREANERLSTLISSLRLAVLMEDEKRRVVFTNDAFVSLFELPIPASQLAGRTIAELGPEFFRRFGDPTYVPETAGETTGRSRRRPVVGERIVLTDNRVLERDYLPIVADGEHRGHVLVFRDVSAQAQAEAEWAALIARQRHENERLVELDRVKAAFLAEISHELRTPLTSISSFTELLTDGLGRDDPDEQREFLEIIKRNADRLLRLVDDLLLLDRLETGAMPLEWGVVDLASVVTASVSAFAPMAESKAIALDCDVGEGPTIAGDPGRLGQVLDVFLSNAVKFTPEGGRIIVTATPRDKIWRIEVIDNGIGVPQREQQSLFERFYRASNARSSRIPGSGLGLSVARAIVELHGGTITLRSTEGGGTTVIARLPLAPDADADESDPFPPVRPDAGEGGGGG